MSVLLNSPQLLSGPIAIHDHQAIVCHTPTDIMKIGVGSEHHKNPTQLQANHW